MCLAIPARVLELLDDEGLMAAVEMGGARRTISTSLLGDEDRLSAGDYVLVHIGFAMSKITEAEAMDTERLLRELTESQGEGYELEAAGSQQMPAWAGEETTR